MAFSGSSYFAGIGTAFAVIAFGFACATMVTTSAVQSPNRLERLNSGATDPSKSGATSASAASSSARPSNLEQTNTERLPTRDGPSPAIAAAPSASTADPQSAPPPQPAAAATAKTDAATPVQEQSAPAATNKSEDAAAAKNERAGVSVGSSRETSRKKADRRKSWDDRKFSGRRRRQDQDERRQDEAANVVRQMPRGYGYSADAIDEQEVTPRLRMRPRHFDPFGDDQPPIVEPPPRFGFFGD